MATPYFYGFFFICLALRRRLVEAEIKRLSAVSEDLTASSHYSFLNFSLTFSLMPVFKSWEVSGPYSEGQSYKQSCLLEPQHFLDPESAEQLAKKFVRFCTTEDSLKICHCVFFPFLLITKIFIISALEAKSAFVSLSLKLLLKFAMKGDLSRSKPPIEIRRCSVYVWMYCY